METLFSLDEKLEEVGELLPESTFYRSLCYKTQESWSCSRRVVTKVCYRDKEVQLLKVGIFIDISVIFHFIFKFCKFSKVLFEPCSIGAHLWLN